AAEIAAEALLTYEAARPHRQWDTKDWQVVRAIEVRRAGVVTGGDHVLVLRQAAVKLPEPAAAAADLGRKVLAHDQRPRAVAARLLVDLPVKRQGLPGTLLPGELPRLLFAECDHPAAQDLIRQDRAQGLGEGLVIVYGHEQGSVASAFPDG